MNLQIKQVTMNSQEIADLVSQPVELVITHTRRMLSELEYDHLDYWNGVCYELPRNEVIILASQYSARMRKAMLDRINELEQRVNQLPDFNNPVAAARAWADAQEQLALAAPKVELANRIASADNLQYRRDVAKQFNWRPKAFDEMLIDENYLYRDARTRVVYAYAHHSRYFKQIQEYINGSMRPVTMITGEGVAHIAEWIGEI